MNVRTVNNAYMYNAKTNYSNYLLNKYGVDGNNNQDEKVKKALESIKEESLTTKLEASSSSVSNCYSNNMSNKTITDLKANNNVIQLHDGMYYKTTTSSGKTAIVGVNSGLVSMPTTPSAFTTKDSTEINSASDLLTSLMHNSTTSLNSSKDSKAQVKSILDKIGVKSGYFDVKSDYGICSYFAGTDGTIVSKAQADKNTKELNDTNWFDSKYGCSKDSTITVEGKDYKIDEKGHINIPSSEGCIKENIKINKNTK